MQVKNISDIFEAQKATDTLIHANKGLNTGDTFEKRVAALLVELGETLNELPAEFKFWSEKSNQRQKALIEYADSLHFLVSLGIDLGIEKAELREIDNDKPIERQFIELSNMASLLVMEDIVSNKHVWHSLFSAFIRLGDELGFTWNEVYDAYFEKNKVNHARQENGY